MSNADAILMGGIPIIGGISKALMRGAKGTKLSTSAADITLDGMEITGGNARSKAALAEIDPAKQAIDRQAADIYNSRPNAETTWDDLTPETRKELTEFYNQEGCFLQELVILLHC